MSLRFLQRGSRPLILGHRGAPEALPENTLAALCRAVQEGADGVELDVMRCGSGEVVVVHDDTLHRVTGGAPGSHRPVRQMTLEQLRAFDLGGGQRVPTLAEALEALGPEVLVNVEMKSPQVAGLGRLRLLRDDGLAEATARVLRAAARPPGTTLVSSFDPFQLLRFERYAGGQVPIGYLFHHGLAGPLRWAWPAALLRPQAVHPDAALVDAVALRRWRRQGYFVHVWTVDDPREIAALTALGVDAIITNSPGRVRRLVEELVGTTFSPSAPFRAPCTPPAASSRPG
ncbi:MAG: glycerophosphodiester phosphodiesterase [Myxococcales bacterium]|nr:glycerophosphodiester phosphodiesterase [Myxococcota bacterium]MDW8280567.1 glycerophosphodiester phosphodiesterase [Myxococcales bacterium]